METLDPEIVAQLYVMQWMHENGHHDALRALEKQVGRLYDDTQLPEASQLMQLVWHHVEEQLTQQEELEEEGARGEVGPVGAPAGGHPGIMSPTAAAAAAAAAAAVGGCGKGAEGISGADSIHGGDGGGDGGATAAATRRLRRLHHEEALRLLRSGNEDYAVRGVLGEAGPDVHQANIIAVRLVPGQGDIRVITAAGDGVVRCLRLRPTATATATATAATATAATATATATGDGGGMSGTGSSVGGRVGGGGSSDGPVVVWETKLGSSALLSLALHPAYCSGAPLVAVGGMDGRTAVLHGTTGALLATSQPHTKYVVRVAWAAADAIATPTSTGVPVAADAAANANASGTEANGADGGGRGGPVAAATTVRAESPIMSYLLVSASMDETVVLHRFEVAAADEGLMEDCGQLSVIRQVPYGASVTDAAFLRDGYTLAVTVRSSNYLRLLDCRELVRRQVGVRACGLLGSGELPELLVNLNEAGDDHVSFTAKYLAASWCGRYLLVCTDTPRLLILRTADWSLLRCLFGLPTDTFPQPAAAWHRDGSYVYVSGAHAQLCVFHVGSGRLVHNSQPHRINLRDLDYDPTTNRLATCSFDKTVKVLGPEAPAAAVQRG